MGKDGQVDTKMSRLVERRDSLSRYLLHALTRTHAKSDSQKPHTHQGIKHKDVIVISLRVFHHNVEQGIQSVLQKLHTHVQEKKRENQSKYTHASLHTY